MSYNLILITVLVSTNCFSALLKFFFIKRLSFCIVVRFNGFLFSQFTTLMVGLIVFELVRN